MLLRSTSGEFLKRSIELFLIPGEKYHVRAKLCEQCRGGEPDALRASTNERIPSGKLDIHRSKSICCDQSIFELEWPSALDPLYDRG